MGAPAFAQIDPIPINRFKVLPGYASILNCGDGAFRNATATLIERGRAGAAHDDLRAWVAAQDQVFANCSGSNGPSIPAALPATAAPWMQADRAYQIAAAEFYAGRFDAAAADFDRIGGDPASPWHGIAPYLAARALIRKTTIDGAAAQPAQEQLRKVLADPDAAAWHASARDLARYLLARTVPERALGEAAHAVATERTGVAAAMNDYRLLLDHFLDGGRQAPQNEDITDWIAAMQYSPGDRALVKWRATRTLPWLVAALTFADRADPELMAAAAQVPRSSPAFTTVEFHRLRLLPPDDARSGLDAALRRDMPPPVRNLFLAARMRVARDWDDLLRYAPRTVAATFVDGWQAGYAPVMDPELNLDDDAARILNSQVPLAMLRLAAVNSSLPPNLRLRVARAVWVRSILLNDTATAASIAPVAASLERQLKPFIDLYLAAPDDQARGFAAAWLMLNDPGLRTVIDAGAGRLTAAGRIDPLRDNWWCPADATWRPANPPLELLYRGKSPDAGFLSAAQRAAAAEEQKRLAAAPAAPTFMARHAVEWAETHPGDPRAAAALALAVRAGHVACAGDAESNRWLKRAFELLHARYGKTEAAFRTPYWYAAGTR